jgi:hypothetical protein
MRWPMNCGRAVSAASGAAEQRRLSIPAVRYRIMQAALKIVFEPVFEAGILGCSFGFRPKRSAHDALGCSSMSVIGGAGGWWRAGIATAFSDSASGVDTSGWPAVSVVNFLDRWDA